MWNPDKSGWSLNRSLPSTGSPLRSKRLRRGRQGVSVDYCLSGGIASRAISADPSTALRSAQDDVLDSELARE